MDRKKVVVYFVVPMAVSCVLMAMYFSGVRLIESIVVAPYLDVALSSRREFGLLENLQNALLLGVLAFAVRGAIRNRDAWIRCAFVVIACGTLFMFLEEIDYGLHHYELITGVHPDDAAEVRNLHNIGDRTSRLKQLGDVLTALFFVIAPFALRNTTRPYVRFFLADPYLALTMVAAFLTRSIAHYVSDLGYGIGIRSNISEFRESILYYAVFLYVMELTRRVFARSIGGTAALE